MQQKQLNSKVHVQSNTVDVTFDMLISKIQCQNNLLDLCKCRYVTLHQTQGQTPEMNS